MNIGEFEREFEVPLEDDEPFVIPEGWEVEPEPEKVGTP
jgi:hypothetical protein